MSCGLTNASDAVPDTLNLPANVRYRYVDDRHEVRVR